jgi:membrane-bound lytic murein transglycosylase D
MVACSGKAGPDLSPVASLSDDQANQEVPRENPPVTMAELAAESLDEWQAQESPGFQDDVLELDEVSRREFYHLYGSDPLGLSSSAATTASYEIPLEMNEHVERWIEFFTTGKGRTRFRIYLERSGAYEDMIRQRLREAEMPEDLLYLAMIESGMNPNAYSRAHAVGLWQFIKGTGRRYDLEIGYWLDERRDPFKATDAAVAHLGDLYEQFGSWYLAAAAYNAGSGKVTRGIKKTGSSDFWDLADARVLRSETRNYVPKLIAATTIAKNPEKYGFADVERAQPMEFDVVGVPDATSFDVLADAAGTSEDEIRRLNPQYVRDSLRPGPAFGAGDMARTCGDAGADAVPHRGAIRRIGYGDPGHEQQCEPEAAADWPEADHSALRQGDDAARERRSGSRHPGCGWLQDRHSPKRRLAVDHRTGAWCEHG